MKFFNYVLLFIISIGTVLAQTKPNHTQQLDSIFTLPFFEHAIGSIEVLDLERDSVIYKKNNRYLLTPASNMKLFTSYAALKLLPANFEFKTKFFYSGRIVGSVLNGNLYVDGGFDPDFSFADFQIVTNNLKQLGVSSISGKIVLITKKTIPVWGYGWMWDDNPSADAPFMSSVCINSNSINATISNSVGISTPNISIDLTSDDVEIVNNLLSDTNSVTNYSVDRKLVGNKNIYIFDGVISNRDTLISEHLNVENISYHFATLLKKSLQNNGIKVNEIAEEFDFPTDITHLGTVSRSLDDVLYTLNKISKNLSAEMILLTLADNAGKKCNFSSGIAIVDSAVGLFYGDSTKSHYFVDGSGISRYNLAEVHLFVELLKSAYSDKAIYSRLVRTLPILGVDGTLAGRLRNTGVSNHVFAKTGTLTGVSSLSGYIKTNSGKTLAFSIIFNNFTGKASKARELQNKICEILFEY